MTRGRLQNRRTKTPAGIVVSIVSPLQFEGRRYGERGELVGMQRRRSDEVVLSDGERASLERTAPLFEGRKSALSIAVGACCAWRTSGLARSAVAPSCGRQ
jgi:hypothetical protein